MQLDHTLERIQRRAIDSLKLGRRGIFLRYGAGKSRIALLTTRELKIDDRLLIICKPRNVHTWVRQIGLWASHLSVHTYTGTPKKRRDKLEDLVRGSIPSNALRFETAVIIPYTLLRSDYDRLATTVGAYRPTAIIMDESRTVANPKAQTTLMAIALSDQFPDKPKFLMSGNPMPESHLELWSQFRIMYGVNGPLGRNYWAFRNRYFLQAEYDWVLRANRENDLMKCVLDGSVWLTMNELCHLKAAGSVPIETYVIESFPLKKVQRGLYTGLISEWAINVPKCVEEFIEPMAVAQKLRQLTSGFVYTSDGQAVDLMTRTENPKLLLLEQVLRDLLKESANRKVVVWRAYKYEDELIAWLLDRINLSYTVGLDADSLAAFQRHARVLVAPLGAAEGLNELVVADTDVYFSNSYSLDKRSQAEKRIARPGQSSPLTVHIDLTSIDTVEEEITLALQRKDLTGNRLNAIIRNRKEANDG